MASKKWQNRLFLVTLALLPAFLGLLGSFFLFPVPEENNISDFPGRESPGSAPAKIFDPENWEKIRAILAESGLSAYSLQPENATISGVDFLKPIHRLKNQGLFLESRSALLSGMASPPWRLSSSDEKMAVHFCLKELADIEFQSRNLDRALVVVQKMKENFPFDDYPFVREDFNRIFFRLFLEKGDIESAMRIQEIFLDMLHCAGKEKIHALPAAEKALSDLGELKKRFAAQIASETGGIPHVIKQF